MTTTGPETARPLGSLPTVRTSQLGSLVEARRLPLITAATGLQVNPSTLYRANSYFTSPATTVAITRPFSFHPANGQLRLLLLN